VELQFQIVRSVMEQANVHLWALQEMNHEPTFHALVEALGEGWGGVWQADMTSFSIGYGYIYRTDVVEPTLTTTILTDSAYEFAFRPPLLMRANITLPGGTISGMRIIMMHAKCCADFQSWERRRDASIALKSYTDNLVAANFRVLVLGDFNDELRSSISSGRPSPYANFRTDDENYHIGTLSLEDAGINTFCFNATCTNGSTIDHIMFGRALFDDYVWDSTARYDALLENIPNYVNRPNINGTVSDHIAVTSVFDFFKATDGEEAADAVTFTLEAPYPNPARGEATLTYRLPEHATVRLEVFDQLGRRVATISEGERPAGAHSTALAGDRLAPGHYVVRLTAAASGGVHTATRRLVLLP
jgi:hypothetical protein